MYWYKTLRVKLNERVVVLDDGLPRYALGPGKHRVWGSRLTEVRWSTDALAFDALPELRAQLPAAWYRELTVKNEQRAILFKDGRPQLYLRPATHRYWSVDPTLELRVFLLDEPMPELTEELLRILPTSDYVRKAIEPHERGLLVVKGKLRATMRTRILEDDFGKLRMSSKKRCVTS